VLRARDAVAFSAEDGIDVSVASFESITR
jgi:hypothetical protein